MKRLAQQTLTLGLALAACTGQIDMQPQGPRSDLSASEIDRGGARVDEDGSPIPDDKGSTTPPGKSDDPCEIPLTTPRAVLLTPRQYVNVLRDVVGADAVPQEDVRADDKLEFEIVDLPRVQTATLDRALRLSERAVESVRGKSAKFLGCTAATDAACVRTKLGGVARKAFKRPATSTELDELASIYDKGKAAVADNGETGVLLALQAILLSPSTMYRTEFTGAKSATTRDLSAHERAAALASLLLDSVPDEPLLAAADDGSLNDTKVIEREVDRLLALPRVRAHVTRLFLNNFKVQKIFETPKDPKAFPDYTPALQQSMYEETRRFVDHVLWQNRPLSELLTSRTSFVDRGLAKIYGVPYTGSGMDFVEVELPASRGGLLTQPSVLSVLSRTEKTSVVARGLFVRGSLLCLPKVPSPPMSIQAQIEEQLEAKASERELAAYRAMTSPCKGCHANFDAFGLLLEEFDAIGRHSGKPGMAVDLNGLGGFMESLSEPNELVEAKAEDGQFTSCLARRTVGFALTEASEPLSPSCAGDTLAKQVISRGGTLRELIVGIATSPAFVRRVEEP